MLHALHAIHVGPSQHLLRQPLCGQQPVCTMHLTTQLLQHSAYSISSHILSCHRNMKTGSCHRIRTTSCCHCIAKTGLLPLCYENVNGLLPPFCDHGLLPLHCDAAFGLQACGMWWMPAGPSRRSYRRVAAWPSTMCAGSARPQVSSGQAALAEPALATATGQPASNALFDVAERLELCACVRACVCDRHDDRCGHACHAECSLSGMLVIWVSAVMLPMTWCWLWPADSGFVLCHLWA